ncbi:MAG: hypothetical protein CMJ49_07720, partial [Planctomycetaceae bacterium]|nr:hypothetical protein [Planctomycetaceae bacterium]
MTQQHPRFDSLSRRWLTVLLTTALVLLPTHQLMADPTGEQVVAGSASFERQGDLTTIHAANNTVINYQSFDINAHETVTFIQPSELARVLNRIPGATPTSILGTLNANGIVYIVNPAGVVFGQNAVIDAAGFHAAGANLSTQDFLAGIDHYVDINGSVINEGSIHADVVTLIGQRVVNTGTILSSETIAFVAGEEIYLTERGSSISVHIEGAAGDGTDNAALVNSGTLDAGQGTVTLAAGDVASLAIHHSGTIKANNVQIAGGDTGIVNVGGTIDASNTAAGAVGGDVLITGEFVGVTGTIDASGDAGGGTIKIGGDYQGANPDIANASQTLVTASADISADAIASGDGGTVIVWSDDATQYFGSISATGGATGGDGGFAEVSGAFLDFAGPVDLTAAHGDGGTLLLDPLNIIVSVIGTDDFVGAVGDDGDPNTLAFAEDPAALATLNAATPVSGINALLQAGNNVELQAHNDITVSQDITGTGGAGTLTLRAGDGIVIDNNITLGNADFNAFAGPTATGNGGAVPVGPDSPGIAINATINTGAGAGNVTIETDTGDVALGAGAINAGTGDVLITATAGAITDSAADASVNITGDDLQLVAANGIGSADAIETAINQLDVINTTVGAVNIANTGTLQLTELGADGFAVDAAAGGSISAASPLSINSDVQVGGDFTFTAAGGGGVGTDDLSIGANVTQATGGFDTLTFQAGDDIIHSTGAITTSGGGVLTVLFQADTEANGDGGITQTGGNTIADDISFSAATTVTYTQATNDAVNIAAAVTSGVNDFNYNDTNGVTVTDLTGSSGVDGVSTTGSVDIDANGTFAVTAGDQVVAGGTGTTLTIDAPGITLGAGAGGSETIKQTGTGTIALTSSGGNNMQLGDFSVGAGTGLTTLSAVGANISDAEATAVVDVQSGGELSMIADLIGAAAAGEIDTSVVALTTDTTSAGGNQSIIEANAVALNLLDAAGGDITLTAGGAVTDNNAGANNVVADLFNVTVNGAGGDIGAAGAGAIDTNITQLTSDTSTNGNNQFFNEANALAVNLLDAGAGDITLTAGGAVTDNNLGANNVAADLFDVTAGGAIGTSGTPLDTDVTQITTDTSGGGDNQFITEANALAFNLLDAGAGNLTISAGGAITDNFGDGTNNVTGANLTITGVGGVGTGADPIETTITNLDATNTVAGDIVVTNTGALNIADLTSGDAFGLSAFAGATITAASPLNINSDVTVGASSTFQAGDSGGGGDDLDINASVTYTGAGAGSLSFIAGDNVTHTSGTVSSSGGALTAIFNADNENDGTGGVTQIGGTLTALEAVFRADDGVTFVAGTNTLTNVAGLVDNGAFAYTDTAGVIVTTVDGQAGIGATGLIDLNTSGVTQVSQDIASSAGNVDIDVTGSTFTVDDGDQVTGGGSGTAVTIDADGITLGSGANGSETVKQAGTGTIDLTSTGGANIDLLNFSIGTGTGTLTLNSSAGIDGTGDDTHDINSDGTVTLTALNIGDVDQLEIGSPAASDDQTLNVNVATTGGAQTVDIDVRNEEFNVLNVTVADADTSVDISLTSGDAIDVDGGATHNINDIDTTASDTQLDYALTTGNIIIETGTLDPGTDTAITATAGDLQIGNGAGNAILNTSNAGILELVAGGSITHTAGNGTIATPGSGAIRLDAGTAIGDASNPIEFTGLTSVAAEAGAGGIFIQNDTAGNVVLTSVTGVVTGNTTVGLQTTGNGAVAVTNNAGSISVDDAAIGTGAGNVALSASTTIIESTTNTNANITTTGQVDLTAGTSIGTGGANEELDIASASDLVLDADVIHINSTTATALTNVDITVNPANTLTFGIDNFGGGLTANITDNAGDLDVIDFSVTNTASLAITAETGNIAVTQMDTTGAGDLAITALGGNVVISNATVTSGTGNITIAATGSINDINDTAAAIETVGGLLTLTAGVAGTDHIGDANAEGLNVDVGSITFTAGGDVTITHEGVLNPSATIVGSSAGGDLALNGPIQGTPDGVADITVNSDFNFVGAIPNELEIGLGAGGPHALNITTTGSGDDIVIDLIGDPFNIFNLTLAHPDNNFDVTQANNANVIVDINGGVNSTVVSIDPTPIGATNFNVDLLTGSIIVTSATVVVNADSSFKVADDLTVGSGAGTAYDVTSGAHVLELIAGSDGTGNIVDGGGDIDFGTNGGSLRLEAADAIGAAGAAAIELANSTTAISFEADANNGGVFISHTGDAVINLADVTGIDSGGAEIVDGVEATADVEFTLGDDLAQTGTAAITAGGNLTVTAPSGIVDLDNNPNAVTGDIAVDTSGGAAGGNVFIDNGTTAVSLGAIDVDGTLDVTVNNTIAQAGGGTIAATGASSFTTSGNDQTITLGNAGNDFGGAVSFTTNTAGPDTGHVTVQHDGAGALDFGLSNITGSLTATSAAGGITQSGTLLTEGLDLTSGGTIDLNNGANNFGTNPAINIALTSAAASVDIHDAASAGLFVDINGAAGTSTVQAIDTTANNATLQYALTEAASNVVVVDATVILGADLSVASANDITLGAGGGTAFDVTDGAHTLELLAGTDGSGSIIDNAGDIDFGANGGSLIMDADKAEATLRNYMGNSDVKVRHLNFTS